MKFYLLKSKQKKEKPLLSRTGVLTKNLHAMQRIHAKNTTFKLSDQVKKILHEKGLSFLFNWNDYNYFKNQAQTAWNKSQAIAEMFLQENNNEQSDYSQYIF